jgi:hypothetical protein
LGVVAERRGYIMGRLPKKHVKAPATDKHGKYITRSMAVRRLQITIAQFRYETTSVDPGGSGSQKPAESFAF